MMAEGPWVFSGKRIQNKVEIFSVKMKRYRLGKAEKRDSGMGNEKGWQDSQCVLKLFPCLLTSLFPGLADNPDYVDFDCVEVPEKRPDPVRVCRDGMTHPA